MECERRAAQLGVSVITVQEDVMLAARIHHFIEICGTQAEEYFLSGGCPIDPIKIAKLSRRMPPFIKAKIPALIAGTVNVVSNPTKAFDTDGWAELTRRLPKFRATIENYAFDCHGASAKAGLDISRVLRLVEKLDLVERKCASLQERLQTKMKTVNAQVVSSPPANLKSAPDWSKAHGRISLVHGVLMKTNRDLDSEFWKPEWVPTDIQLGKLTSTVKAMANVATTSKAWLRRHENTVV